MKPKILLVDDDTTLTELVQVNLSNLGYQVIGVHDGWDAIQTAINFHPDIIILDVMMPGMDGYAVCKKLREITNVPVIFLTAKGREQDLIHGFEVGGDDYLRKPFSNRELEMRISALLKRTTKDDRNHAPVEFFDNRIRINLETRHVYKDGKIVHLTPTEFRLLSCLVKNLGAVVTHEDLLREAWGENYVDATASLSLYIRYLREKIEDDPGDPMYIMTKWGIGYWFSDPRKQQT